MTLGLVVLGLLGLLAPITTVGEVPLVQVGVDGLACPFCAYGLEKKLKKLPGVKQFDINIKQGEATLSMEEGTDPDLDAMRAAVKAAGFTVRDLTITAIGTVTSQDQVVVLNVRDSPQRYALRSQDTIESDARLAGFAERSALVSVTGRLHDHAEDLPDLTIDRVEPVETVLLTVKGMTCEKCDERITALLAKQEGVYRISVDLASKYVAVESIGRVLDASSLITVINAAGFEASLAEEQP